jgi:hypothetical protein
MNSDLTLGVAEMFIDVPCYIWFEEPFKAYIFISRTIMTYVVNDPAEIRSYSQVTDWY